VLAVGDRIGVLFDGRLSDLMPRAQADASRIGMALSGATLTFGPAGVRAVA